MGKSPTCFECSRPCGRWSFFLGWFTLCGVCARRDDEFSVRLVFHALGLRIPEA
jgi:hypothetical protein